MFKISCSDEFPDVKFVKAMLAALFFDNPMVGFVLMTFISTCFSGNFSGEVCLYPSPLSSITIARMLACLGIVL